MITIKEMAEMLGISTTTVSNVINGKTSEVSQKTAEKVQKLLDEYDYVPNMNAKNLAQNHSRLIGIVLKRRKDKYENIFTDPFHGELLGALESAIREQGYYMMIYISEDIEEIVRNIVGWNTEGLILIGMLHDDYLKIRSKYKKPAVLIDSYTPKNIARYVNIGLDDEEGGYLMTKYLLDCGHRKIAFLADNMEGVDYIRYTDYYAVTRMKYLKAKGIRFPEDLSITGFDDNLYAQLACPSLTTIHQDIFTRGTIAAEYLFKMIDGWNPKTTNLSLPVRLVVRDSVKLLNPPEDDSSDDGSAL